MLIPYRRWRFIQPFVNRGILQARTFSPYSQGWNIVGVRLDSDKGYGHAYVHFENGKRETFWQYDQMHVTRLRTEIPGVKPYGKVIHV